MLKLDGSWTLCCLLRLNAFINPYFQGILFLVLPPAWLSLVCLLDPDFNHLTVTDHSYV